MKKILILLALVVNFAFAETTKEYKVGIDYDILSNDSYYQKSKKIEVTGLFWYGCPHCYSFEPEYKKLKKSYTGDLYLFQKMPVPGASDDSLWTLHARMFYAMEKLNIFDKFNDLVFEEYHEKANRLSTLDAMATFFDEQGVNPDDFKKAYNSSEVTTAVNNAKTFTKNNNISGVPAVIINRQYLVSAAKFRSLEDMTDAINFLIAKVKKDNKIQ